MGRADEKRFCPLMLFEAGDRQDITSEAFWCRKDWCEWFDQGNDCCSIRSIAYALNQKPLPLRESEELEQVVDVD